MGDDFLWVYVSPCFMDGGIEHFLLVFPLKFVYKNALQYSDSRLPKNRAQVVLSYRKVEISPSMAKFR